MARPLRWNIYENIFGLRLPHQFLCREQTEKMRQDETNRPYRNPAYFYRAPTATLILDSRFHWVALSLLLKARRISERGEDTGLCCKGTFHWCESAEVLYVLFSGLRILARTLPYIDYYEGIFFRCWQLIGIYLVVEIRNCFHLNLIMASKNLTPFMNIQKL